MTNLFDSSSEEEGSEFTRESRDSFISQDIDNNVAQDEPNDVTTFRVATVLRNKQPEPVQSNYIRAYYEETNAIIDAEEERDKLRITSSLMDDEEEESTDSDNDGEVPTTSLPAHKEDIFRSSTDKQSYISLNSWQSINLLDEASQSEADTEVIHKTYSYSDKFNSVYDEVATVAAAKNKADTTSNDNGNRFQNVRTSFSAAVKTFGAGLTNATACDAVGTFPLVASSWDVDLVDSSQTISGTKRTVDNRFSVGNYYNNNKRRRRMPLDIRSELVLMQDKMDQYEVTIQSLQRDNSTLSTANSNLQSTLEQSNKALQSAQLESRASKNRADSLTFQLNEMKSEMQRAKQDLLLVQKENDEAKKAVQVRMATLEKELSVAMRKEQERHKLEIASLKSQISSAEQTVEECQEVIERQAVKIVNLEVTLAETTTAATDALEVARETEEERDLWKSRALLSPKAKSLAKYFTGKQQRQKTPATTSIGKENNHASGCCSLCFKEQSSGIIRWCKCGKAGCHKWAHAKCLAKGRSNVSTSVSHPGTPPPPLPLILCNGIEPVIRK
jgi:predicted  nucleic acid-binding Zn-ribbon protein